MVFLIFEFFLDLKILFINIIIYNLYIYNIYIFVIYYQILLFLLNYYKIFIKKPKNLLY